MSGGEISGNTVGGRGGGVYVDRYGTFNKTGGTIFGYSAGDTVNSNLVKDVNETVYNDRGHAVYIAGYDALSGAEIIKRKETTAVPGVNLSFVAYKDSSYEGFYILSPTISGAWDY